MHNLDEILDEVRQKYYCSKYLNRPTISWSKDYITDYFGEYTLYNNHITISRILNTNNISRDMLASVIYHESLHQDFQDHDENFERQVLKFPNYYECGQKLDEFAAQMHAEMEYPKDYNAFTKGKETIVYILLPNEDYPASFSFCNQSILVDFDAKVTFNTSNHEKMFYVFLVECNNNYHIVGWCQNGILYNSKQIVKHKKFDDTDYSFQLKSSYDSTCIIPPTCCDYRIEKDLLPQELSLNSVCVFNINDPDIQPEIDYIESYCEGYLKIGFDLRNIDCISDFMNVPLEELRSCPKNGYANVWLSNAIYEREPTCDNLIRKAVAKYQSWLLDAALDDFIKALSISNDVEIAFDIIKIAVLAGDFEVAKEYMHRYQDCLPSNDTVLKRLYKEINEKSITNS